MNATTPAKPIVDEPKPSTAAQKRAAKARAAKEADAAAVASIPDLFRKGRTIAQIAVTVKRGQQDVRDALDAAGVDYSADKNNGAPREAPAKPAAPAKEKAPRTLTGDFDSLVAKPLQKGKQTKVAESLSTDEAVAIAKRLADTPRAELGRALVALHGALNRNYARVS